MRRRQLLTGGAVAAFSCLATARAQGPARLRVVGVLATMPPSVDYEFSRIFREELVHLGWIEGRNVLIRWKNAEGQVSRFDELAAALVRANVDVIVVTNPNALLAARRATSSIPIVMVNTPDPVEFGFVSSLARPGGNVTGTSSLSADVSVKQLELITELLPGVSHLAVLSVSSNPWHPNAVSALHAAAPSLGVNLDVRTVHDAGELEQNFAGLARDRVQAVLVLADPLTFFYRARLAELGIRYRLPVVDGLREYAEAGALMAFWPESETLYRRTAAYVDKLLKGARAETLPVEQPTKYELVINLKTARSLGLDVPPSILARADKVIQ